MPDLCLTPHPITGERCVYNAHGDDVSHGGTTNHWRDDRIGAVYLARFPIPEAVATGLHRLALPGESFYDTVQRVLADAARGDGCSRHDFRFTEGCTYCATARADLSRASGGSR